MPLSRGFGFENENIRLRIADIVEHIIYHRLEVGREDAAHGEKIY